jgi:protein-L-isoaspartate(D-aspartate) O-methyltransferase
VTAAAPKAPQPLLEQLAQAGRLLAPVGARRAQALETWERQGNDYLHKSGTTVAFVPLLGKHGWPDKK